MDEDKIKADTTSKPTSRNGSNYRKRKLRQKKMSVMRNLSDKTGGPIRKFSWKNGKITEIHDNVTESMATKENLSSLCGATTVQAQEHEPSECGSSIEKKVKIKKEKENGVQQKQISSNDVKDGCTVFLKNVPFEATSDDVKLVCQQFGPIIYALINTDPVSKHSKGTAFVRFETKESADLLLSKSESQLIILDSIVEPLPALARNEIKERLESSSKDHNARDSRNLYLAKEGLIMANSKAAEGVSASDMAKRHKLEKLKADTLKNLNRFVSRNRLSIHNLPLHYGDEELRKMIIEHTNLKPHECRVMRYNSLSMNHPNGKSKGFGFMSFQTHQNALTALRKLNNNPNIFGPKNRPIVAFSIEDRSVHKIKQKRLEKSKQNNPTYVKKLQEKGTNKMHAKKNVDSKNTTLKKGKNAIKSKDVQNKDSDENFMGTTAKPGQFVRMRSDKKIQEQSKVHAKNVRKVKRLNSQKNKKLEKIKDKSQKHTEKSKNTLKKIDKNDKFPSLVQKYRNLIDSQAALVEQSNVKRKKSKWYEE